MIIYIYGLVDPRDNRIRYVGKTNDLYYRLSNHWTKKRSARNHKNSWLINLEKDNLKPTYFILEECTESNWQERERYWIAYYRSIYDDLTNSTDGGDGGCKVNADIKAKISKTLLGRKQPRVTVEKARLTRIGSKGSGRTSSYIGVRFIKSRNQWVAVLNNKHLGYFEHEELAALCYDYYARNMKDRNGKLNFSNHEFTTIERILFTSNFNRSVGNKQADQKQRKLYEISRHINRT